MTAAAVEAGAGGLWALNMLTKGERVVLERMAKDEELVQATPGGWWLDDHQISGRVGRSLLRKILISEAEVENENYRRYHINEWGRNALVSAGRQVRRR